MRRTISRSREKPRLCSTVAHRQELAPVVDSRSDSLNLPPMCWTQSPFAALQQTPEPHEHAPGTNPGEVGEEVEPVRTELLSMACKP